MQDLYNTLCSKYLHDDKVVLSYPIYIPSKGRHDVCSTANVMSLNKINYSIVVEPQDYNLYQKQYGLCKYAKVVCMDKNDMGIAYVRNFIKQHAQNNSYDFMWVIDDNARYFEYRADGSSKSRIKTSPKPMMYIIEQICKEYVNIGAAGMKHDIFAWTEKTDFNLNRQVYSCVLLKVDSGCDYREGTVEDTDYSLQLLSKQLCTIVFTRLLIVKKTTMKVKGGNTEITYAGNGRLNRSLKLQSDWPQAHFKLTEQYGRVKIKPSRIWRTFSQVPMTGTEQTIFD